MNGPVTSIDPDKPDATSRRTFLKASFFSAAAALVAGAGYLRYVAEKTGRLFSGKIVGASASVGHLLRDGGLPAVSETREIETVIVGGGIAGLSAAWWLKKQGYENFKLLELEPQTGGTSGSGKNKISGYPWGAHYLPLPGPEAKYVRTLLEELGVIEGYDKSGSPIYNEFHLCADPHERLLIEGRWQDGVIPQMGLSEADRRQYGEFFELIESYKDAKGRDGKPAFVIPVDLSSSDKKFRKLDEISMAEFMNRNGWDSKPLNWYVNYCCRDDFGATTGEVSAWAGVHYFASRTGHGANADAQTVLTWPEGNGWLAARLREKVSGHVETSSLVHAIRSGHSMTEVEYYSVAEKKSVLIRAKKVIFAGPRFVAGRVIEELKVKKPEYLKTLQYAPWLVANISLRRAPQGRGAPLSWDNVSYDSESLGYVVATHQGFNLFPKSTVITYYKPLSHLPPSESRKAAAKKSHGDWVTEIVADLVRMHRGIEDEIENVDVCVWGHGMIIPTVGFISGQARQEMLRPAGPVHFAHADMSGFSIFEEAQFRGVKAAESVLHELRGPRGEFS